MPDALTIFSALVIVAIVWWALKDTAREFPFEKGELRRCLVQMAIAGLWGAPVWFSDMPEPEGRYLGTIAVGFGGLWLTMKVYAWLRYGKGAKIRMD